MQGAAVSVCNDWFSEALCVCSSLSDESAVSHSTNVSEVARHLQQPRSITFSTYASLDVVAAAQDQLASHNIAFDLIVSDEAHITAGLGEHSAMVLNNERIRSSRRLHLTATPRILGKDTMRGGDSDLITTRSMDDTSLFGPVVYKLSQSEANAAGITVPVKLVVMDAFESTRERLESAEASSQINDTNVMTRLKAFSVQAFQEKFGLQKIISFSSTNARAHQISSAV